DRRERRVVVRNQLAVRSCGPDAFLEPWVVDRVVCHQGGQYSPTFLDALAGRLLAAAPCRSRDTLGSWTSAIRSARRSRSPSQCCGTPRARATDAGPR